ncbi:MAG: hypothetical protein KDA69_07450 [Planctomycetaceae bacterium]|nr:hypothetical protein [Planctomycetaceae bacterium]MCA9044136.1 hypothetical protein [Planctomycetaceae bacterium]
MRKSSKPCSLALLFTVALTGTSLAQGEPVPTLEPIRNVIDDVLTETEPTIPPIAIPEQIPAVDESETDSPPPTLSEFITTVVRECVPDTFEDDDDWGKTVRRWDGIRIKNFKTSRRWKEVNNGVWHRYTATLIRPEETLTLEVQQLEPMEPGTTPFFVRATVRARGEGTFAHWTYGVKGINGTVIADATLELQLWLTLESNAAANSWQQLIPLLNLHPRIDDVKLRLRDFDVRKVSQIGGTAADLIGDGCRKAVESLIRKQEKRIKEKLQKRIDRWTGVTPLMSSNNEQTEGTAN